MNTMQSHGTVVSDMPGSLSEPDILASQQYYDYAEGTSGRQPEKSLMAAVLLDAVECFQKHLLLHDEYSNRLFKEAENWILDNDREWLFSFINICDTLAIDPHYLRQGLLHWKQNAMKSVSTRERTKRSA
jgi:hypothetical protein